MGVGGEGMENPVIFTDLDGTLLDHGTYSFEPAIPALGLIEERGIPLVICTSKTRAEIEKYRIELGNRHPFISENGGGIFIPHGYFGSIALPPGMDIELMDGLSVIRLGSRYPDLRRAVEELRMEGFAITGFGDMTAEEVAALTGLSLDAALLAKEREFDEPFLFEDTGEDGDRLEHAVRAKGFNLTMGRFFHILGESDKGRAFSIVADLYREKLGEIITIALGDSPNDIPMLERTDIPILVKKPNGKHDPRVHLPRLIRAEGVGPSGWNAAIISLLKEITKKSRNSYNSH
jgi:mannosyl-3-phosphoglycerate phosphatase